MEPSDISAIVFLAPIVLIWWAGTLKFTWWIIKGGPFVD